MSFNKIILVGNCTKDGEMRFNSSGMGIYNTSLAVSRKFTRNGEKVEETLFVDITAFSKLSEICNQYLRKGSKILVEGRLNFDQWVDQNGQKRSKHSVVVETMQMLDSKGDNQSSNGEANQTPTQGGYSGNSQQYQNTNQTNHTAYRQPQAQMPDKNALPEIDIDESSIPF